MILQVFVVKDRAMANFAAPYFVVAPGQALRNFVDEINRAEKDNQMYMHPDDFELYHLGEFETENGIFKVVPPVLKSTGSDVKIRKE